MNPPLATPPGPTDFDGGEGPADRSRSVESRFPVGPIVRWSLIIAVVVITLSLTPWHDRVTLLDGRRAVVVSDTPTSLRLCVNECEILASTNLVTSRVTGLCSILRRLDVRWLAVAICLGLTIPLMGGLRWLILLRQAGASASAQETIFWQCQALAADVVGIGQIGVEAYRMGLARKHIGWANALAVQVQDKCIGLLALIALALCGGMSLDWNNVSLPSFRLPTPSSMAMALIIGVVVVAGFLIWRKGLTPKVFNHVRQFTQNLAALTTALARSPWLVSKAFAMSLLLQLLLVVCYQCLALALGFHVSFPTWLAIVPIVALLVALPITVAGIGVFEGSMVALLTACTTLQPSEVLVLCALHRLMALPTRGLIVLALLIPLRGRRSSPDPGQGVRELRSASSRC